MPKYMRRQCPLRLVRRMYFARFCVFFFRTIRSNVVVNRFMEKLMLILVVESSTEHPMPNFFAIMVLKVIGSSAVLEKPVSREPTRAVVISVLVKLDFQPSL